MLKRPPEFISGLVTGEGCFYADSGFDQKYKNKYRLRLFFEIEMRADESNLLDEVRNHLRCGNLYYLNFGRYKGYEQKNWRDHIKYRVSSFEDIALKVIPFFEIYRLYGTKLKSFELFRSLATYIEEKKHLDSNYILEIKNIVTQLQSNNKKGLGTR